MNKINLTICGLILFFILLIGLYFHQKGSTLVKVNEGYVSNQNSEQERVMRLLEERYGIGGGSRPVSGGGGSRPVSGGSWAPPSLHIHHNHHVTGGDVPGGHVTGGGGASHGTNPLQPPSHPSHHSSSNPDNPVGNPTHHTTGGNKPPPHSSTLPGYYLTFQYNNMTYYLQEPTTINNINMSYTTNINDATTFNVHNAGTKNRYFTIVNPKNNAGGPNKPFSLVIFFGFVILSDISNLQSQISTGHVNNDTSTGPIQYQIKGFQPPGTWVNITPTLTTAPHGSTVSPAPSTHSPHGSTVSPAPSTHSPHGSTVSPSPVTHSPSGSSPHTYTHCHTHSDPNHTHSQSDTINVVASKYTKSIRT